MFCIALLLLQCLFGSSGYTFKVGDSDFYQVDLFDSLHLHNNTYQGVALGTGSHMASPGVVFTGDYRETMVTGDWIDRIRGQLVKIGANEFTISALVKQNPNNVGTLLAFSRGLFSALEIQSSGRKNELRVISGSTVETFPFRLADGNWHRLAIAFSASQVDLLVDCRPTFKRVLKFDPATAIFDSRNISIWIGQKTSSHFLYQGVMQDLRLTFGPYGYLSQCPQMDSQCPTCSEFSALKMSFASLQSQIQLLTERLSRAEARLTNVEQCDCQKSCRVNETSVFGDGSTWHKNCDVCACKKGEIECHRLQCPEVRCKNPITHPGECCPTCLKQCFFRGRTYDHGESESMRECVDCECMDGSMQCKRRDPEKTCPALTCPPSEQVVVSGECCKVCPGTDYCATQGDQHCHSNATCVNLKTTFTCRCKEGFSGDGQTCQDVDECLLRERNHCARNTQCVNNEGSYSCECIEGFKKINAFQCDDLDECSTGTHHCHTHATCLNSKGSYSCSCNPGYTGTGFQCSPICNLTCENGGTCIAPDVCSCRSGWTGFSCETDIDECLVERNWRNSSTTTTTALAVGVASLSSSSSTSTSSPSSEVEGESVKDPLCPENSVCVNKAGWHLCQCRTGFQLTFASSGPPRCQDIDECKTSPCADGLICFNTIGSYECRCPEENNNRCSPGCFHEGTLHTPGSSWFSEDCRICTCSSSTNQIICHKSSSSSTSSSLSSSSFSLSESDTEAISCSHLCSLNDSTLYSNTNTNDNNNNNNVHINNNNIINPSTNNNKCCSHCTNLTTTTSTSTSAASSLQKKSCRHQHHNTLHQSGEMWHFQCQTCECLDGEIDCWPIDCPPINCKNAVKLQGDCCYRCPEDSTCTHRYSNNTECQLLQNTIDTIKSGTRVTLPHRHCITCKCQNEDLCCEYDYDCVALSSNHRSRHLTSEAD